MTATINLTMYIIMVIDISVEYFACYVSRLLGSGRLGTLLLFLFFCVPVWEDK